MAEDIGSQNVIRIGVTITENDVFETTDLPEDDQQLVSDFMASKESHKSDNIESSRIDASEVFKIFADKVLDSEDVDFSDSIATNKLGYPSVKKQSSSKKETLEEKYARLKKAVEDLSREADILRDKNESDGGLSTTSMATRLEFLQRELCHAAVKDDVLDNDPQKLYQRKLLNDIDLFLSSSPSPAAPTSSSTNPDTVEYQMYCLPGQSLHADNALVEDLEQRIDRCENFIGLESDKFELMSGENPSNTLLGALSMVTAKFALLDLTQLTHFESSLLAIQQKQIQASSKSEASDIADKVDKVSQAYEVVKKANPLMEKLPDISERLKNLVEMHESATQFSQTLAYVDASQNQLMEHLQSHTEHLKQIQALLGPQMTLFEANCKTAEELVES